MKTRMQPYGYKYVNGNIVEDNCESEIVKRIYELYKNGQSLLDISKVLNEDGIEYMPGVVGWNKARIMRILDDERYVGTDIYPVIIDKELHDYVISIKYEKNMQKETDRSADIYKLKVPIICPKCSSEMHRYGKKHKRKSLPSWQCLNQNCKHTIFMEDDKFINRIINLLNTVIRNPDVITIPIKCNQQYDVEIIKLENEIQLALDKNEYSKEELLNKMLKCASQKYQNFNNELYLIQMMKKRFEHTNPMEKYSENFVNKTVKSITIKDNQSVSIELMNGQTIGKEEKSDDRNHLQSNGAA